MDPSAPRLGLMGTVVAAVLILLVAASPLILYGDQPTPLGAVTTGLIIGIVGLALRMSSGHARSVSSAFVIAGAVMLVFGVASMVLAIRSWGY